MKIPADSIGSLADACWVRSGFTARSALTDTGTTGILTIQQGDLTADGEYAPRAGGRTEITGHSFQHYAAPGDVLFRSRGPYWSAWEVPELEEQVLVVAPLFILRPIAEILDPSFLKWTLMQPPAQRYFAAEAKGTMTQMITKSVLEALPIDIPPIETQRIIGRAAALAARERELNIRLARLCHARRAAEFVHVVQQRKIP